MLIASLIVAATLPSAPALSDGDAVVLAAEQAITANQPDRARELLEPLAAHPSGNRARDNQVLFLLGLIDLAQADYAAAIARFHRVLVTEPGQVRVRLELGRAYFMAHDYENARAQFLYARAGHLPKAVLANVDHYLDAIRFLRRFSYGFTLSVAGDSNLNAGPATDSVTLFGLPFQLPPASQANAGVGLAIDGNAEWAPRVGKAVRWRSGLVVHRSQYRQTAYDDMTTSAYSGPHVTLKKWDFNLLGTLSRRWYGDRVYTDTLAGSVDATWFATTRFGLGGAAAISTTRYAMNPLQTGGGHTLSANVFYIPTTTSIMRASAAVGWQGAEIAAYANRIDQLGVSYTREFGAGITLGLAPGWTRIAYDAPLAAFGTTRVDHQLSGQVTLLDRRIDWHGLTPRVVYTYTRNDSTIGLYRFRRSRVELGLTRMF